jgi:RNA 3'-terminal phosphate cyclase (ATP)
MTQANHRNVELDGSQGEGGGQILRSALTLSMITGTPFRIGHIRAKRKKPGLLRQHLTAIEAAAAISGARVEGALAGSQSLTFAPQAIRGGDYRFAIGTAGSCTLVLQTVLPALWYADAPSTVTVSGGTHNPGAPPADFLIRAWLPLMRRMGAVSELELLRHGFYPAGGGEVRARVAPSRLAPLKLCERGEPRAMRAEAVVAAVPGNVARRELEVVACGFSGIETQIRELPQREGPGNALLLELAHGHVTELFTSFGERGISAEAVAGRVVKEAHAWLASGAAVGEHLADQLALPLALAGGGSFTTHMQASHLTTNLDVIERFLPVRAQVEPAGRGWRISIAKPD